MLSISCQLKNCRRRTKLVLVVLAAGAPASGERERVPAEVAVMVGDRAADIIAAKNNGIRSVGVLWGYGSEGELTDAGADKLCLTPGELVFCLSQIVP